MFRHAVAHVPQGTLSGFSLAYVFRMPALGRTRLEHYGIGLFGKDLQESLILVHENSSFEFEDWLNL